MNDPHLPARQANYSGHPFGLFCKYEYDVSRRKSVYKFYRHGRFVGATACPENVAKTLQKFIGGRK